GKIISDFIIVMFLVFTFLQIRYVKRYQAISALILVPILCARLVWAHHVIMVFPALFLLWKGEKYERYAAIFVWVMSFLFLEYGLLFGATVAWFVCCWPKQAEQLFFRM